MITQTGIRRPDEDERIGLGTCVRYHHLVCEMRLPAQPVPISMSPFSEMERQWVPCGSRKGFDTYGFDREWPYLEDGNQTKFRAEGNKTFAIWPAEGQAIVVSLIRKGIGHSSAGYESGYEYPEWNEGYFVAKEWVWLYVLKPAMTRMDDFLLAPMDAVAAVADPRTKELEAALRWLGRNDANGWVREKVHSVLPKGSR